MSELQQVEKVKTFRSGYTWSTPYAKEKMEEQRTITVSGDIKYDVLYAYQLITQADLRHMVVYNAFEQGLMDEDEKIELLTASVRDAKIVRGFKDEIEEDEENKEMILGMYKRIVKELVDEGIIGKKN